jgi:hypothetical protein
MMRSISTVALMLLPQPLLLLVSAHLFPGSLRSTGWSVTLLVIAALVAGVALLTSRWPREVKLIAAVAYIVLTAVSAPFLGLWAVCLAGDCL